MFGNSVLGTPMIFVDEVDGIHGRGDYGGVAKSDILKEPTVSIILAAMNPSDKMKNIKKVVKIISFKIPPRLLRVALENKKKKMQNLVWFINQSSRQISRRHTLNDQFNTINGYRI